MAELTLSQDDIDSIASSLERKLSDAVAKKVVEALSSRPSLLDRHQLAAELEVSVATVDRMRRGNEIPCCYIGSSPRFELDEVLSALSCRHLSSNVSKSASLSVAESRSKENKQKYRWKGNNPDREIRYSAIRYFRRDGIKGNLPEELIQSKIQQIKILRLIKGKDRVGQPAG